MIMLKRHLIKITNIEGVFRYELTNFCSDDLLKIDPSILFLRLYMLGGLSPLDTVDIIKTETINYDLK